MNTYNETNYGPLHRVPASRATAAKTCFREEAELQRDLEAELQKDLQKVEEYLSGYLRDPGFGGAVGDILRDMERSKGKRLRPQLVLLAGRYGEGFERARDGLCRLGALVELLHMASLIHDDIVDDAPLRRGQPTVQSKYGKDMAVYAGDLLLSRIVQSLFRDGFVRVGACFGETVEAMCMGELGQMEHRFREDATAAQYMHNIYGKTAALCRLACAAGAIESGCSEEVRAKLEELGVNFGYMFQIRDDLLDFVSDTAREGKCMQMDFREGILTLPVLYAMERPIRHGSVCMSDAPAGEPAITDEPIGRRSARPSDAAAEGSAVLEAEEARQEILGLMRLAREGRFGEDEAERLTDIVAACGGLARARADMEEYAARAIRAVEALPDCGTSEFLIKAVRQYGQ